MSPLPFLLRRLGELRLLDGDTHQAFMREGVVTFDDLALAIAEGRAVAAGADLQRATGVLAQELRPLTLGRAWDILEAFLEAATAAGPMLDAIEVSGAVRRAEPTVGALVVVARASDPARAVAAIAELPIVTDVVYRTLRRVVVVCEGHEIDVRVTTADEYGSLIFTTTGPPGHVAEVLKRRGPRLSASEIDVYATAGLAYLPAETRHTPEALGRAVARSIPHLVQREDIVGDLHMHTTYSDGRNTLAQMVQASRGLGYEYIAITDHSEHAGAARTLTADDLERQREELARLRDEAPGMTILHGLEVDIMPDGSLDCRDSLLEKLDIVLASLHDAAGHDGRRLTRRCLGAIRHPLVSVITHPSNQLVGKRPGYDLDYAAIYEAAAETGTALEVDGAPSHLDLSGERAAAAARAGATLVIDSDCHRARSLDRQMRLGVGTARRGWIEPQHVLNTRPVADVRAFVARKRAR